MKNNKVIIMNSYKQFISFFRSDNKYRSIVFPSSLNLCRLFSNLNPFNYSQIMAVVFILFEFVFLLLCVKSKNRKVKKSFHYFTIFAHIILLYLIPFSGSRFFLGMEASIILYQNFKQIASKITRILFLFVLFLLTFTKDFFELDIGISYLVYYLFTLTIFEQICNFESKNTTDPFISEQESKKSKEELQKNIIRNNSLKKNKEIPQQIPAVSYPSVSIMNLINIGIAQINNKLDITFANKYIFDLFQTRDLTKIKNILFNLEENLEMQQSDFQNIPDFDLPKFFHKSCIFGDSVGSFKIDDHSENSAQLKPSKKLPIFSKYLQSTNSMQEDVRFENWKKRYLNDNAQEKFVKKNDKKPSPKSVLKYLVRLNDYYTKKSKVEAKNDHPDLKSDIYASNPEHKNYSMFADLILVEEDQSDGVIICINFIPLLSEEETIGKPEILIFIRTLSDMELKYLDYNKAKNRILGSFCHELRTPINAIINMLDLMQAQMDETVGSENNLNEHLLNATVSSYLLLSEIDDFIDYFAYCNEMLEVNPVPFEINSFFQEIQRIFSFFAMKKNLGFTIDIDKNIPATIYNDEKRLKQIIFNLISKKIKKK